MTALVRSASLTHFSEVATQSGLDARALVAQAGLPVYALPLPASRFGILENQLTLGGLAQALRYLPSISTSGSSQCIDRKSVV